MDKTEMLIKDTFKVLKINPSENLVKEKVLQYAAYAEIYSNHPIAVSIMNEFGEGMIKKSSIVSRKSRGSGLRLMLEKKRYSLVMIDS
ncbi:hypothetical protein CPJCM30710_11690 [Clostridium polyendosporum]|uniref:Uncharacterized protein n=1 Tax=Clostridium polyendosporum TaxID=69208 RepID=A0A919VLD7_9CLOT|nr:hypothetical protein [Clostridium polyendosporum]GIM28503.1 hypothetical protein CPJCM30710_11690 [Clostridium polyendosporum]